MVALFARNVQMPVSKPALAAGFRMSNGPCRSDPCVEPCVFSSSASFSAEVRLVKRLEEDAAASSKAAPPA